MNTAASARSKFRTGLISSGILVPLGMGLLMLMDVVLARKLGPVNYGMFSYVLAAASLAAMLAAAGIPATTMRFLAQYADARQWELAGGILRWSLRRSIASAVTVALLIVVYALVFLRGGVSGEQWLFVALLTLPMVLWVWQRCACLGLHQVRLSLIPHEILLPIMVASLAFLPMFHNATGMLWAYALSLLAIEIVAMVLLLRGVPPELKQASPAYSNRLWLTTSLALALNSIMQLGMNRSDLLILAWHGDMHETGIYNASVRLALIATPISRVVITFTGPLIAAAFNNSRRQELDHLLRRSRQITLAAGIPLCALLLLFPDSLSALLYGETYRAAGRSLLILAVGQLAVLFSVPSSTLLWMGGGERQQAAIALGGVVLSVALCFVLIPVWGAQGAALATTSSLVITSLLYIFYGRLVLQRMATTAAAPDALTIAGSKKIDN